MKFQVFELTIRLTSYKTVRFEGAFVSQIDGDADAPLL